MAVTRVKGRFNSTEPLPLAVSELTPEWFSKQLETPVESVILTREVHSTSSKVFLELRLKNGTVQHICLKGGFHTALIEAHPPLFSTYRREAELYYYISPHVKDLVAAKTLWCGTDTVTGQGLAALEDITYPNDLGICTFGTPLKPWTLELAKDGVAQLAALHAHTWGAPLDRFPWLADDKPDTNPMSALVVSMVGQVAWDVRFHSGPGSRPPVTEKFLNRERMERAFRTHWRTSNPKFRTIIHGDCHIGNTFFTESGAPGFLDYQTLHADSALHDVAYFIGGSMEPEDRRRLEREIIAHYLDKLSEFGGPRFSVPEVWDEYRKCMFHGLVWPMSPDDMQPRENVWAMTRRYIAALEDHRSLELLEDIASWSGN